MSKWEVEELVAVLSLSGYTTAWWKELLEKEYKGFTALKSSAESDPE